MPGGLGQLATGVAPPEILRKLISATRTLTDCPFAVNLIIETTAFGPLATDAHLGVCIEERVPRQSAVRAIAVTVHHECS
jgi:enoyl-[acyl-carrier protein] reductase II